MPEAVTEIAVFVQFLFCDIPWIFPFFRDPEPVGNILRCSLMGKEHNSGIGGADHHVIATGGSAIYRGDVIEKMKENGIVVYLKIPYEVVEIRLGDLKKRGVVLKEGFTLKDLYNERVPLYERHADYIVELNGNSVEDSAEKIRKAILGELINE